MTMRYAHLIPSVANDAVQVLDSIGKTEAQALPEPPTKVMSHIVCDVH